MRGIAEECHGVDTTTIDWYVDDEDEIPVQIPSKYDVADIRPELKTFIDYAVRDGLLAEPIAPADLFFERSLEDMPTTV